MCNKRGMRRLICGGMRGSSLSPEVGKSESPEDECSNLEDGVAL